MSISWPRKIHVQLKSQVSRVVRAPSKVGWMGQPPFNTIFMIINFEQVHNYFERVVFEAVARMSNSYPEFSPDMLADVACVALNRLPARYLRHDVDMMFYLTETERHVMDDSLQDALNFAFGFVAERSARQTGAV